MSKTRYGWWESYLQGDDDSDGYKTRCTACGGEAPTTHDDGVTYAWKTPSICPHCGATMMKEVESWIGDDGYEYITLKYPQSYN